MSEITFGASEDSAVASAATDHDRLVEALRKLAPSIRKWVDRASPALRVIDCVLSLNRPYNRFVVPRLNCFELKYPQVRSISELKAEIERYASPHEFVVNALTYNHETRAIMLGAVVNWLATISGEGPAATQLANLETWAREAHYTDHVRPHIPGFALAGFQYLRMLFGANTTKPDIYICRFVKLHVGHPVSPLQALALLEAAAAEARVSLRDADGTIWEDSERKSAMSGGTEADLPLTGRKNPFSTVSLTTDGKKVCATIKPDSGAGIAGHGDSVSGALRDLAHELERNGVQIEVTNPETLQLG